MPFRRLPGSSGRYADLDTGEILSRRQYQKAIGKPLPSAPEKPGAMSRYSAVVNDYVARMERDGIRLTKAQAKQLPEVKAAYRIIRDTPPVGRRTEAQAQALVEALEAVGRRPRAWEFYLQGTEST